MHHSRLQRIQTLGDYLSEASTSLTQGVWIETVLSHGLCYRGDDQLPQSEVCFFEHGAVACMALCSVPPREFVLRPVSLVFTARLSGFVLGSLDETPPPVPVSLESTPVRIVTREWVTEQGSDGVRAALYWENDTEGVDQVSINEYYVLIEEQLKQLSP